jgi:O-succinylbenzoate synthase
MDESFRKVRFEIPLRLPVSGVKVRSGYLIEGPAGWGEYSPLPSWDDARRQLALEAALEAASNSFESLGADCRRQIPVNVMVPEIDPASAEAVVGEMLDTTGCTTVKVKVGDEDGLDRLMAVKQAVGGRGVSIRADAGGVWDLDTASSFIAKARSVDLELIEDPVADLEDMAFLRRRCDLRLAAEKSIGSLEDARRLRLLEAADVVVLKPQRLGGIRRACEIAEAAGVAAVASSALETSVGLAAVLALAAALGDSGLAHGVGTAVLLERDVSSNPLVPREGTLRVTRPRPDSIQSRS